MLIITLVFEKNANFFAENCQKSQKIVIITSTPEIMRSIFHEIIVHRLIRQPRLTKLNVCLLKLFVSYFITSHFFFIPNIFFIIPCHWSILHKYFTSPCRPGLEVSSPPVTEETVHIYIAMGLEIEFRQGIGC
jgi:hypothetical protein